MGNHEPSTVDIKVKNNLVEIGANTETMIEQNGNKSMSKSSFATSFTLPSNTIKDSVKAEFNKAKIVIRGTVEKDVKILI